MCARRSCTACCTSWASTTRPTPARCSPTRGPSCGGRRSDDAVGRRNDAGVSRSGFVALAGRPNVGKSTLVNLIVGEKVAIVSDRAQTTRRAIRAVQRSGDHEIVLVDLPGVQRPGDALSSRMAARVQRELGQADATLLMVDGEQGVGAGDRHIAEALQRAESPVVVAVNKVDRLSAAKTAVA